jgi:polysaccharide biosynthesis transport protein
MSNLPAAESEPPVDDPVAVKAPAAAASEPEWRRQEPAGAFSRRKLLRMLRRHRILMAAMVIAITGLAAAVVFCLTPLYRAEATLVVQRDRAGPAGSDVNTTEAAVIGSEAIAAEVVKRLNLAANPLFAEAASAGSSSLVESLLAPIRDLLAKIGLGSKPRTGPVNNDAVINAYLAGLSVLPSDRSNVIILRYSSPDPRLAATAVNATIQLYLAQQALLPMQPKLPSETPAQTPDARIKELGDKIAAEQKRLEDLDRASAAVPPGGALFYQQQLAQLSEQIVQAQSDVADAQSRFDKAQRLVNASSLGDADLGLLNDPALVSLREQEVKQQHDLADLKTQYRDSHPKVKDATTALATLHSRVAAEIRRATDGLSSALQAAKAREKRLNQDARRIEGLLKDQANLQGTHASVESELKADRELYHTLLTPKSAPTDTAKQDDTPLARPISQATVPTEPYYPRRALLIGAAFVFSLVIAFLVAAIAEYFDRGFRTLGELERASGLLGLGLVPFLPRSLKGNRSPHHRALEEPNSTYGEAIRALRTSLLLSHGTKQPRVIMLTSSIPGEGKTSTALAIATSAAKAGQKCILVECDVLRPALAEAIGAGEGPGLGDFFLGTAAIPDLVRIDPRSGAHYIMAGRNPGDASDMLTSPAMRQLIAVLRRVYDLVVLDSPPVLPVSDSLVLQRLADDTLYLVRWRTTPRDIVFAGLRRLYEADTKFGGVILTQVDVRKHAQLEFGASGENYYSAYRRYHSDAR